MSIFNTILIIIIVALIVAIFTVLFELKKIFTEYSNLLNESVKFDKENRDYIAKAAEQKQIYDELLNQYVLLDVAHSIVFMLFNLCLNNDEKFSFYFNNLYFFGVPKEFLEDNSKIIEFHNNCLNNKYVLEKGEPPFKYKFVEKK